MRKKVYLERIMYILPRVKLIVILRDPAIRAISGFNHNCHHGRYIRITEESREEASGQGGALTLIKSNPKDNNNINNNDNDDDNNNSNSSMISVSSKSS
jgi:hypothetical protein